MKGNGHAFCLIYMHGVPNDIHLCILVKMLGQICTENLTKMQKPLGVISVSGFKFLFRYNLVGSGTCDLLHESLVSKT